MNTDARREEFVDAAYNLFTEKGVQNTSVTDIAKCVGVTRSLFYHYFLDKQAVVEAVIDEIAEDFLDKSTVWYRGFDHNNARESLLGIVSLFRSYLFDEGQLGTTAMKDENPELRQQFVVRVALHLSSKFEERRLRDGTPPWADELPHPRESYYVMAIGLLSLMSREPEVSDEVLVDIIADVLHIHL